MDNISSPSGGNGPALSFLDSVALAYTANFGDLSEFCFVFPNKRAGAFFMRSLSAALGRRTAVAPEVMATADFMERLSERETASRVDLLFRLYSLYRRMRDDGRVRSAEEEILEFDSFRGWGEILLSDFSEVDQYDVDPDMLFANVSDFKEIASNFLTDEQVAVLERYFGYSPSRRDVERFWKNLTPPENLSEIKSRFMYMWQMMSPLYHALSEDLEAAGLATPGAVYRHALARVRRDGRKAFPWKKIVFIGFNALSTAEALVFEEISKAGGVPVDEKDSFADFFWDATGPVLESEDSDAASFLRLNIRNFPSPSWAEPWMERCRVMEMPPDLRVIASPSNSAQAKIAAGRVAEIVEAIGKESVRDARVAVVLPDENLLLPLLHALPETLDEVNLTMGYSLRLTSVASFLHHLRRLNSRARSRGGVMTLCNDDLRLILAHPFSHAIFGSRRISALNAWLTRSHRLSVPLSEIAEVMSAVSSDAGEAPVLPVEELFSFDTAPYGGGTAGAIGYLDNVLVHVDAALAGHNSGIVKSRLDRSHIAVYRDALRRLALSAAEHDIPLGLQGVFYMVDKLLAGERVTFEGEPLEGLQVMGLLETRALDFEHLVILSLNDRVMPRKSRHASFIPDALRCGYGMPYSNYQETLFSYYFYRMISRARSVTLIYDARSGEGMRSGGESRYIMQLRYLYARGKIRFENRRFLLAGPSSAPRPVEKTPAVMAKIAEFAREGSGRNFSASALRKYGDCQVRFYFEVVENLRTDVSEDDYIDPVAQGNIIHEVMLNLYFPAPLRRRYLPDRILMPAQAFDAVLADRERISVEVRRAINRIHFGRGADGRDTPLDGSAAMVAAHLERQVAEIVTYDRSLAPLSLAGGEMTGLMRWEYAPGRAVNMKYAIDRLDVRHPGGEERWRIVDYKTGASLVEADTFDDIFNGASGAKNIFQLLLYANLMNRDLGKEEDVKVSIYEVNRLRRDGEKTPSVGRVPVAGHLSVNGEFLERLDGMISEIFDPEVPFRPTDDESHCAFCRLKNLCGRGG